MPGMRTSGGPEPVSIIDKEEGRRKKEKGRRKKEDRLFLLPSSLTPSFSASFPSSTCTQSSPVFSALRTDSGRLHVQVPASRLLSHVRRGGGRHRSESLRVSCQSARRGR